MAASAFGIAIPDDILDDLRWRLRRARFTTRSAATSWQAGADPDYLRDLVAYWADDFDWRQRERELNALPTTRCESLSSASTSCISGRCRPMARTDRCR